MSRYGYALAAVIISIAFLALVTVCTLHAEPLMIDSWDTLQRQVITEAAFDDCDRLIYITNEYGELQLDTDNNPTARWRGTYCGVQSTDYSEHGGIVEARVQISIGCDNETPRESGLVYGLQEKEYTYVVRIDDGTVLRREPIEISPHLIKNNTWVREFRDPDCRKDGS